MQQADINYYEGYLGDSLLTKPAICGHQGCVKSSAWNTYSDQLLSSGPDFSHTYLIDYIIISPYYYNHQKNKLQISYQGYIKALPVCDIIKGVRQSGVSTVHRCFLQEAILF